MIKVGYLISYDYEFVKTSLPRVYEHVEEIFFAIDVDRKTWAGQNLTISEDFWKWVKDFDKDQKIKMYEDKFYIPGLSSMECETRERNLLAECMGTADWYLQIDSDEYFMDFGTFVNKLRAFKPDVPTSVYCGVVTLFRELPASYLLIDESHTSLCFATNNPKYDLARTNSSENAHIYWQDLVVHQSWAREPSEIKLKLNNWGHKDDFNTISFYNLWNSIDEFNYNYLRNFHPLDPIVWHKLILFKGTIQELLDSDKLEALKNKQKMLPPRKPFLSRLWKKIKKLFR